MSRKLRIEALVTSGGFMAFALAFGVCCSSSVRVQAETPPDAQAVPAYAAGAVVTSPGGEDPNAGSSSECDRPGKVRWIQFEGEARHVYLLKVNSDDGSRTILHYDLLPDGEEQCRLFKGPYASGSPQFHALEVLELELQDCCSVQDKPWLYLITSAQDSQSNFRKRINDLAATPS
ncbi:MAG: hypothetical protein WCU88_13945 [Elusimicrobiota bacterium]|jgi:hypothetical protein